MANFQLSSYSTSCHNICMINSKKYNQKIVFFSSFMPASKSLKLVNSLRFFTQRNFTYKRWEKLWTLNYTNISVVAKKDVCYFEGIDDSWFMEKILKFIKWNNLVRSNLIYWYFKLYRISLSLKNSFLFIKGKRIVKI